MRSCTSPVGRLESHQRGFWIKTPFQMQKTKALRWLFPECVRRVEKYNTIRQAYSYFGGYMLRKYQGKTWDLTRPCTSDLCRMTLSWVGFLTLAPGNGGGAGPCSITFSLESECVHLFWRGGNCREMGPKHVCPISFHVICWLLTWVFGEVNGTPFQYSCLENPMDGGAW